MSPVSPNIVCSVDVAIAGGGIVGLTLANALKASGLKIAIVEALPPEVLLKKPQAYAISLLSSRIFRGMGIWQRLETQVGKFSQIRLSDADFSQSVPFGQETLPEKYLGFVGEHPVLLKELQQALETSPVQWFRPAEIVQVDYQAEQAILTLRQQEQVRYLQAKLVVAADGARSTLRTLAGIPTKGWKYWQSCVAFTIQHQAPRNDIAFERFWYSGPMGVLPLPGDRCQIVWTLPHAQAQEVLTLEEGDFLARLQRHLGDDFGDIQLVNPRRLFPVQLMQSDRYVQSRLALVGDAAHCCHPVGGQGLNLGIRDVAALAQTLQEAVNQGKDIGDLAVLKRYERWRRPENWVILGFTDFLDRLFSNNWWPLVVVRRVGLLTLRQFPPLKVLALRLMTGLLGRQPSLAQPH
ncbi:MAG: FAD-dependent hydroxylase [Microcystaceae cyanobacterium]